MKPASGALLALLATRQFYRADLYEFTLVGGAVLRYCTGDRDVVWNSQTWSAGGKTGPFVDRAENKAQFHWKVGIEVDTVTFDVIPGDAQVNGVGFLSAIREGIFDGATLVIYRAFMPTYGDTTAGTVILFTGRVSEVVCARSLATFNVSSHLELLNQKMPRNLYQSGCVNTLYDGTCGVNPASFSGSDTCASGSTASLVKSAGLTTVSNYFDMGKIVFTSGVNNGVARTIKTWTKIGAAGGNIYLISPLPNAPAASDAFTVYAGCDKTQSTCQGKFSNLANFRGFPYIPENSTAV